MWRRAGWTGRAADGFRFRFRFRIAPRGMPIRDDAGRRGGGPRRGCGTTTAANDAAPRGATRRWRRRRAYLRCATPGSVRPLRLAPGPGIGGTSYGTRRTRTSAWWWTTRVAARVAASMARICWGHSGFIPGWIRIGALASPRGASTAGSHRFVALSARTRTRFGRGASWVRGKGARRTRWRTSVLGADAVRAAARRAPGQSRGTDALEQSSTEHSPVVPHAVEGTAAGSALEHADGSFGLDASLPVGSARRRRGSRPVPALSTATAL